jgi:hypothetical protein
MRKEPEEYSDEEAERRTVELIKRARFTETVKHKSLKDFVGTTPRAKAMARRRKAKGISNTKSRVPGGK